MRKIWKYAIEVTDEQVVEMPGGANILCVQMQGDQPMLWAEVFPDAPMVKRTIHVYGTGNPMPEIHEKYIGTFQLHGGLLVFHVFEG